MEKLPDNMSGLPEQTPGGATSDVAFGATNPVDQGEAAPPEEQAAYEQFVASGMLALNDKAAASKIIKSLDTEDPRAGVALVSAAIISRVIQAAKKAGNDIPRDVILHGTSAIVEQVIERSEEVGVHAFSKDPKMIEGALVRAFDEVRLALQGMGIVTKEGAAADMAEIQAGQSEISQGMPGADQGQPSGGLMGAGAPVLNEDAPPMNRQQRRASERSKAKGGM
jgi:hypothetical protein